MIVVCPGCNKQHQVSDAMAGKRAKCGCGQILAISAAAAPQVADDDWLNQDLETAAARTPTGNGTAVISPATASPGQGQAGGGQIVWQCRYGAIRKFMWWLIGINMCTALFCIPAGFFWNEGWAINNAPLPPWGATLLFECVGFGILSFFIWMVGGHLLHRNNPQRVAVTTTGVLIPKGRWSSEEIAFSWNEMKVKHVSGPVDNIYFKRGVFSKHLTSMFFADDDDFEAFVSHLRQHGKVK